MVAHACWAAALLISVTTGRRYATESLHEFGGIGGLCDAAFPNGTNGPFGYGQNAAAENAINRLLLGGAVAAGRLGPRSRSGNESRQERDRTRGRGPLACRACRGRQ